MLSFWRRDEKNKGLLVAANVLIERKKYIASVKIANVLHCALYFVE